MSEENPDCSGYEVVCPDGLVRTWPYHNLGDAEDHAKTVSDPEWFADRRCHLAEEPSSLERSLPPCPGGMHVVRPIMIEPPPPWAV